MRTLSILFCLLIISCTKDKGSNGIAPGRIINIESLHNISLGQTDTIIVTFGGGTDGCAKPDHLVATLTDHTITIKSYYNYPVQPQNCTQNIPVHQLQYVFKPASRGNYIYKSIDTNVSTSTTVN
jgi:hypothetical protein